MGEALIARRGGGGKLNAILEQYRVAAGESVSANGFVRFVDDLSTHSLQGDYPYVAACALDENTVLAVGRSSYTSAYVYAWKITFSGQTGSVGTRTQVANTSAYTELAMRMRLIPLNANTAVLFVPHSYSDSSNYWGYAVISVSGDALTAGATMTLSGLWDVMPGYSDTNSWDAIPTGNDQILCVHSSYLSSSKTKVYARAFGLNATSPTYLQSKRNKSLTVTGGTSSSEDNTISVCRLSDGRYLVLGQYKYSGTTYAARPFFVTDSGSAITITNGGKTTLYTYSSAAYMCGAIRLSDQSALYVYARKQGTYYYLYGRVISASASGTVSANTETQLSAREMRYYTSSTPNERGMMFALRGQRGGIFANGSKCQVIYMPVDPGAIYSIALTIAGNAIAVKGEKEIVPKDETQTETRELACDIAQPTGDRRVIYTTINGVLTGTMLTTAVGAAVSGDTVDGVAAENAAAGTNVDVYRPA